MVISKSEFSFATDGGTNLRAITLIGRGNLHWVWVQQITAIQDSALEEIFTFDVVLLISEEIFFAPMLNQWKDQSPLYTGTNANPFSQEVRNNLPESQLAYQNKLFLTLKYQNEW
ncbi:hypothetical protein J6590_071088 [Homalodisca vitripennis]|nr:hypothetical protein J6590_071088 [Homalodisca vitripennis]